jgi:hypothetical protein
MEEGTTMKIDEILTAKSTRQHWYERLLPPF